MAASKAAVDPLLDSVIHLAVRAGKAALRHYRTNTHVHYKIDKSPLTAADIDAHHIINDGLRKLAPRVPVISEEGRCPSAKSRRAWKRFWLVDPLDGTKEFLKASGQFTVNIALIDNKEPVLGVVYAPALGLCYYASKHSGSWKKSGSSKPKRIYFKPWKKGLVRALISKSHAVGETSLFRCGKTSLRCLSVGSSLKFCYLAEGKAHVYPRISPTMEWDVAAGDCVYRYASRTGSNPSPLRYNKSTLKNGSFVIGDAKVLK